MAGSQLVLHNRDDAPQEIKDVTRNIGLQSILYNENVATGVAVKNVQTINNLINTLGSLLFAQSQRVDSYTEVANKIYYLLQNAYYTTPERTQRLLDLQNGAKRYY